MAILKVEGLLKTFKEVRALDNVSFEFEKGILSFGSSRSRVG
jgi:ABC-type multidrug transport system ATPase subunit